VLGSEFNMNKILFHYEYFHNFYSTIFQLKFCCRAGARGLPQAYFGLKNTPAADLNSIAIMY
jgi:hypothetical protein